MKKVIDFLKENNVLTLATSLDDKPRASILEYYVINDSIIFATSKDSIKANNLKFNSLLSLSVCKMPRFVTIDGYATDLTEAELAEYNKKLDEHHPEFKELVEKGIMKPFAFFKVAIDTAYYNDYSAGMAPTEVIKA